MRPTLSAVLATLVLAVGIVEVQAAERIRVLIVDGQNNHAWKDTTPVLRSILEDAGCFEVNVATSPPKGEELAGFRPAFDAYDVVLSNYNGELWSEPAQEDFEKFVSEGGGFVCVHAANNAFPNWPEYNEMIGLGGWGGRTEEDGPYIRFRDGTVVRDTTPGRGGSHGRQHDFLVVVRAPAHPITAGLPIEWMHAKDELYDRLRGPASDLTVLATAFSDPRTGGTGENEPMLMTVRYDQGRVFHTTLGHSPHAMKCVGFRETLERGTEWAATGKVVHTIDLPPDFPTATEVRVREGKQ